MKFRAMTAASTSGYDELIEAASADSLATEHRRSLYRESVLHTHTLEDHFDGELNLSRRGGGSGQHSCCRRQCSRPIEDVRVGGHGRRRKIGVIENVEDLGAELHIESLGNPLDV